MKVLELFAGTRSIGKAFEAHGHQVFSVEWDKSFENIDLYEDVLKVTPEEIVKRFGRPDVIWASPDCTTYSIITTLKSLGIETSGEYPRFYYPPDMVDKAIADIMEGVTEKRGQYHQGQGPHRRKCRSRP